MPKGLNNIPSSPLFRRSPEEAVCLPPLWNKLRVPAESQQAYEDTYYGAATRPICLQACPMMYALRRHLREWHGLSQETVDAMTN